jgi:hypothetical protein
MESISFIIVILGVFLLFRFIKNSSESDKDGKTLSDILKEEKKNRKIEKKNRENEIWIREEDDKREREQVEKQKNIRERILSSTVSKLKGNWYGKNQDGLVEIVFEDEKRLTIIRKETDILSLQYKILSIDEEEILLEVDDEGRVSEVSLRFMKDSSGRIHFKTDELEMVLEKKR